MNVFSLHLNSLHSNAWYKVINYPGGELQVRLNPEMYEPIQDRIDQTADTVKISGRIKSAKDYMELALLCNALSCMGCNDVTLLLGYFPYARADRQFTPGDCHGLKTFMSLLSSIRPLTTVVTLDIHSNAYQKIGLPMIINQPAEPFIVNAIQHVAIRHEVDKVNVLYPDAGARTRYNIGTIGNNCQDIALEVFHCEKKRDPETGKLLGFDVPIIPERPTIIIDDICDGGGTFLGIAKEANLQSPLALYTTHGIYSNGTEVLFNGGFEYLYTTNSFYQPSTWQEIPGLMVYNCVPELLKAVNGECR
jgi:ribose-phosphate pyrophosphokinase